MNVAVVMAVSKSIAEMVTAALSLSVTVRLVVVLVMFCSVVCLVPPKLMAVSALSVNPVMLLPAVPALLLMLMEADWSAIELLMLSAWLPLSFRVTRLLSPSVASVLACTAPEPLLSRLTVPVPYDAASSRLS